MLALTNTPNDAMKKEALLGLSWRKKFGRGGTMVGVARARDIANGANLSLDTIKRMNSFFARHEVDKEAEGFRPGEKGYPSNGRIAWALWGGDPGKSWASSKLETLHGGPMIFPEDEEFLAHYGAKGMRWGVRNDKKKAVKTTADFGGTVVKTKVKVDKKDVSWAKDAAHLSKRYSDIHNRAADLVNNNDIPKLNKKYKGQDISPNTAAGKKYDKEFQDHWQKRAAQAAKEAGPSPSGTMVYTTRPSANGGFWLVPTPIKNVKHSFEDPTFEIIVERDKDFFITKASVKVVNALAQSVDFFDKDYLKVLFGISESTMKLSIKDL